VVARYSDLEAMEAYFDSLLSVSAPKIDKPSPEINRTPNPSNLSLSLPEKSVKTQSGNTYDYHKSEKNKTGENATEKGNALYTKDTFSGLTKQGEFTAESIPKLKPLKQLLEEVSFEPQHKLAEPQALVTHLPKVSPRVEVKTEVVAPEKLIVEPKIQDNIGTKIKVKQKVESSVETETDLLVQHELEPIEDDWDNIETADEFQVLFFVVAGVTFGVPLKELGGIHKVEPVTPLFGKPAWYSGLFYDNEKTVNVVDTACWIMPGKSYEPEYKYFIMLGDSGWGLSAEILTGTEVLDRDNVLWRTQAGKRPWLAGMIKEKMCALLHVRELIVLLDKGLDISGDLDEID